jgi:outer membrane protein
MQSTWSDAAAVRRAAVAALAIAAAPGAAAAQEVAPLTLSHVVELTLARSPDLTLAELDARSQAAALLLAAAPFDPRAFASANRDRTRTPLFASGAGDPSNTLVNTLGYQAGVDWQLRSGLVVSPSLAFSRAEGSSAPGVVRNTGVAAVDVAWPLLRGRGGGSLTAVLRAGMLARDASQVELGQVRAAGVLDAINAYWGYVAATDALGVYREAEERAGVLVERTRSLIEADERPAVDSISVLANVAAKTSQRLSAENAVSDARHALAHAMGVPTVEMLALPGATEPFPRIPDAAEVQAWPPADAWVQFALRNRPDLAAARLRRDAAGHTLRGARAELRPRLDLVARLGYTGIGLGSQADRLLTPFGSDHQGAQLQVGVSYDLPLGNHAARGQLERASAADARSAVVAGELERSADLAIATAGQTLRRTAESARLSEQAVRLFGAAVEGEMMKFQMGTATLFEVIQAEDNRTSARLSWIEAQRRYALALAQLRFQAGTLPGAGACPAAAPAPLSSPDGSCPR